MKNLVWCLALAAACGCGKKTVPGAVDGGAAATTTTGTGGGGAAAGGEASKPPVATAAGGDVTGLAAVTDCPKSLAGTEEVARTIKKECGPIPVTANYAVDGSLTLEAGVVLKFAEGAELTVGYSKPAKLIVKGTAAEPVTMTAAGDAVAGFWKGVHLYDHANRSQLEGLVIEHAGDDRGALHISSKDVVVKGVTVRNAKEIGLRIDDDATVAALTDNVFENAGKLALSLPPGALGGVGGGNKFSEGAVVEVRGGAVTESAKWQNPGAPLLFTGNVGIDGKNVRANVELVAPMELRFAEGVELSVGYSQPGALTALAAADKPIVFTSGGNQTAGAWKGLHVYPNGEARLDGVTFSFGGSDESRGALAGHGNAVLDVKNATFTKNKTAVSLDDDVRLKALDGCKFSESELRAVLLGAANVQVLGAGNSYAAGEKIEVRGGRVASTATWAPQAGAVVEIEDDLYIDNKGVATFPAGLELRFKDGASLSVGYSEPSSLRAQGTPDKPVRLRGVREEAGAWDGVTFYAASKDSVLQNVIVEHAGGDAGVVFRGPATAKIDGLTCNQCSAAVVKWECDSKVTLAGIKAEGGTPAAEVKPEGCQ